MFTRGRDTGFSVRQDNVDLRPTSKAWEDGPDSFSRRAAATQKNEATAEVNCCREIRTDQSPRSLIAATRLYRDEPAGPSAGALFAHRAWEQWKSTPTKVTSGGRRNSIARAENGRTTKEHPDRLDLRKCAGPPERSSPPRNSPPFDWPPVSSRPHQAAIHSRRDRSPDHSF